MEVILLERVGKLGHMGDTVRVKDGYARNFLLPHGKALRATEANKKKFESQRADLEARNLEMKREAGDVASTLDGKSFVIIRQAGETGQLYGSVSARDIADAVIAAGFQVQRSQVALLHPIKTLGLHKTPIHPHPEVEAFVTINVARSQEQAERQAKGEDLNVREETSMDDLGLEVGQALAAAGPNASLAQD
ncbi:MAG: 50S ribosomal protein L9 [Roseiarcus sp.]|jgi:large subunit ribosomal protein L9|uniref:50S ribosomal protein L9 n=1 Tax=Roseiarcus sp. TaxID=1969460 RepID=UPI003C1C0487